MPIALIVLLTRVLRLIAIAFVMAIFAAGTGHAQSTIDDGIALVEAGRRDAARLLFKRLADGGNAQAMYHLGALAHSGASETPALQQAIHWYRKAAAGGVPEAQLALGSLLYKGKGARKDLAAALQLFTEAAEAGLLAAQYNLAMMHTAGLAHTKAYNADEDKPRAYKWFTVVLAQLEPGDDRSAVQDALDFVKKDMTPWEIAKGKELAREWLAEHPVGATQK